MPVHGRTRRTFLLALAWCAALLAAGLAAAPAAQAYTYVLRPDATQTVAPWSVVGGVFGHDVLRDAVTSPTAPGTATDYLETTSTSGPGAEIGFETRTLRPGEQVVRTRWHVYFGTGSNRALYGEVKTTSGQLTWGTSDYAELPRWGSLESTAALTQAEVDDLRSIVYLVGSGSTASASRVYAQYVLLETSLPAPAPTITASPGAAGTTTSPSWSFSASPAAGFECRLERPGVVVSDWSACTSARTYDLAADGHPDATYTFSVRALDDAGVAGPETTSTYTLDRVAPAAPAISAGPPPAGAATSVAWSFTVEDGAAASCRLERDGVPVAGQDWTPCAGTHGYDLSGEPDGTYAFRVQAIDAAGNLSAETVGTYLLDRVAPDEPVLTSEPSSPTSDATPTWEWAVDASLTYDCRLDDDDDGVVVSDWASCASPKTYDVTGHADGPFTISVRARDAAGNVGPATSSTVKTKRTPPGAPSITSGPTGPSQDDEPSYAFTTEADTTTECRMERPGFVVSDWSPCVSPRVYDLRLHPDAEYTFRVRATDAAGNQGPEAARSHTLDRSSPGAPAISGGPASTSSDDTPSWTLSAEAGAALACRLERDGIVVSDWSPCTSPFQPDLRSEADGVYTLLARATDAAGNTSDVATTSYTLDRDAPSAPVITGQPPASTSDPDPVFTFTAEADATLSCRLERGATVVSGWTTPCPSPRTYALAAEVDGDYRFRVRATDRAGNVGSEAIADFTLDRIEPGVPTIASRPPDAVAGGAATWAFTGADGSTFECRIVADVAVAGGWAACTSPATFDLAGRADGTWSFQVREVDSVLTRGAPATDVFVIDTVRPAAPVVTESPGDIGRGSSPQWAFTAERGAGAECRLLLGRAEVRRWGPCTSPRAYDLGGEPDGAYAFEVRVTDAAGNTSREAVHAHTLDRVPPAPPVLTAGPGVLGSGRSPAWSFGAEAGAVLQCRAGAGDVPPGEWASCASPFALDLAGRDDGAYSLALRAVDAAGNEGPETLARYTLDTTPGGVQILSGPGALGRTRTPQWTFAGEAGAAVECRLTLGTAEVAGWQGCATPHAFDLSGLADGVFRFAARATDPAGNPGPVAEAAYELDTTPPAAPTIERRPAAAGEDASPTWRFAGEADAAFACRVERRSGAVVHDWAACDSPFTADLLRADPGEYRLRIRATDPAGNTGAAASDAFALEAPKARPDDVRETPRREKAPAASAATPRAAGGAGDEPAPATRGREASPAPASGPEEPDRERGGAKTTARDRTAGRAPARDRDRPRPPAATPDPEGEPERGTPAKALQGAAKAVGKVAAQAAEAVAAAVVEHPDKSVFPSSLIFIVLGFLGVQNRIDRSDPKLALAPVSADPDMEFPPPPPAEDETTP